MHRAIRVLLAALAVALVGTSVTILTGSAPAQAASSRHFGVITGAYQYRNGIVSVRGYAFDSAHPRNTPVCLWAAKRCQRPLYANHPSPHWDKYYGITGPHAFHVYIRAPRPGVPLALRTYDGHASYLDAAWISTPGQRVVAVARKYVGGRYSYGGASPRTGFDCSGYAMYSYRQGQVQALPHNANAQAHAPYMRLIRRVKAQPGDLVFYYSGGSAYHVAIYAGHGYQYSAADPADGIRFQKIWSRNIQYRTDWH